MRNVIARSRGCEHGVLPHAEHQALLNDPIPQRRRRLLAREVFAVGDKKCFQSRLDGFPGLKKRGVERFRMTPPAL